MRRNGNVVRRLRPRTADRDIPLGMLTSSTENQMATGTALCRLSVCLAVPDPLTMLQAQPFRHIRAESHPVAD